MARTRRDDVAVRLGANLVKMARNLSVDQNVALAKYPTEQLRPLVERDLEEMTERFKKPGVIALPVRGER